jgi:hypothetical protein
MLKGSTQVTQIVPTGTVATGSGVSTPTLAGGYGGVIAYLNVAAASGTSPSLAVKLQDSPDGVTWYDVPSGAFTAATAVGTQRLSVAGPLGNYVRASYAATGTTPSFTFDVQLSGTN